jgi:Fur family ferric uptake transcriptional regulator
VPDLASALAVVRERGLRLSSARRIVLEALFSDAAPLTADEIARGAGGRVPPCDLASVYRNLETLEEHGVVRHFHAGHGPGRYVLVGGGEPEYLACDRCGSIEEVDRSELDSLREDVERRFGYAVGFTHFPMVGLCPRCADREGGAGQ